MKWIIGVFFSTLGRKLLMAFTGLFLIIFLVGHLAGNLQLFIDGEVGRHQFNAYAKFMTTNPVVKILSYVTYFSILLHIGISIWLGISNKNARPVGYAVTSGASSMWTSRNMGVLGTFILIFLVIHLKGFFVEMHWGDLGVDSAGNKDLHSLVVSAYSNIWYVLFYVVSMLLLAFHLSHGFASAFQTLGLNHKKYTPIIKFLGMAFAIVVPLLFASIPVVMYLTSN